MDIQKYIKQQGVFLKAEVVLKNPNAVYEIIGEGDLVTSEKFGNERLHLPIRLGEEEFTFDVSKTNCRFIESQIKSADTQKWIGRFLLLETYKTKTSEGKLVDAINVKSVK